jgi:hypothetical protein
MRMMQMRHGIALIVVLLTTALGLNACGAGSGDEVARVAGVAVSRSVVAHLAAVLANEHVTPGRGYTSLRAYALALLLVSTWLIGEARSQGVGVSPEEAMQSLRRKARSFPNGEAEFDELMRLSGRTLADAALAERSQLSASRLDALLTHREAPITDAQVSGYYRRHKASFAIDEQRKVAVAYSESRTVVERIKREMSSRARIDSPTVELLEYAQGGHPSNEDALYNAIYAAKLWTPGGPIHVGNEYFVFELTAILPSAQEPLAAVAPRIAAQLREQQHRATVSAFFAAFQRRWAQRTDCEPGWVVEQCREYHGRTLGTTIDPFVVN